MSFIKRCIDHVLSMPVLYLRLVKRKFGMSGAARLLFNRYMSPKAVLADASNPKHTMTTPEGLILRNRYDYFSYLEIFANNCYRSDLWGGELQSARGALILDVGANIGMFSALCAFLNKTSDLYAFDLFAEAEPLIRERFAQMHAAGGKVVIAALGARDGDQVEVAFSNPFDTGNTIVSSRNALNVRRVPTLRLDTWYSNTCAGKEPFLIKMDIEGAEKDVVPSSIELLGRAKYIMIELHSARDLLPILARTHEVLSDVKSGGDTCIVVMRRRS